MEVQGVVIIMVVYAYTERKTSGMVVQTFFYLAFLPYFNWLKIIYIKVRQIINCRHHRVAHSSDPMIRKERVKLCL